MACARVFWVMCVLAVAPSGAVVGAGAEGGSAGARAVIDASGYPSLQAAIDALPPEGGLVKLPPGKFEMGAPLVLERGDVTIEGCGSATWLESTNLARHAAIVVRPPASGGPKETLWRVQLSNFRLTGCAASGHGIEAIRVNEILLDRLTVSGHGGDGIRLDNCYEDPRVANCLITYNKGAGLRLIANHDIVVVGNHFEENQDAVVCADGFNLCMSGNNVDDHLGNGVVIENTYGSQVVGNMIEECQGTGVILDRDAYGITISANVIAHDFGGGVDLRDAHGCAVTGNSFPLCGKFAIRAGPASGRNAISGNAIADSHIGEGAKRVKEGENVAAGIVLSGASHIAITGNTFGELSAPPISVEGDAPCRKILIRDNVFTEGGPPEKGLTESLVSDNLGP
ncbi:MAG: right-handed parallel beta-helix repeat-containing protein [Verrucomicrobiae bacterium]|nr:right-handed parallel beta-helix repeat-containing protein [Verrucomicrobiae bacterium]